MDISWADLPKRPSPARDMITSGELSAACTAPETAASSYQTTFHFDDISRHPSLTPMFTPRLSPRPIDPIDRLADVRVALTSLEGNRQLPGEDVQLVSLSDHSPLK